MKAKKVKRDKFTPRPGYEFVVTCASCGQGMTYTDNGVLEDDEWECTDFETWTGQDSKHNEILFCSEECVAEYYASRDECLGHTAEDLKYIGGEVGEKVDHG